MSKISQLIISDSFVQVPTVQVIFLKIEKIYIDNLLVFERLLQFRFTATKPDINGKKHLVHKTICLESYIFQGPVQYFMNPEFAECSIMDEDGLCKVHF
jgi:hypothetical protein